MQNRVMKVHFDNLFWPDRNWIYFFILDLRCDRLTRDRDLSVSAFGA